MDKSIDEKKAQFIKMQKEQAAAVNEFRDMTKDPMKAQTELLLKFKQADCRQR